MGATITPLKLFPHLVHPLQLFLLAKWLVFSHYAAKILVFCLHRAPKVLYEVGFPLPFIDLQGTRSSFRAQRYFRVLITPKLSGQRQFENWECPPIDG